MNISRRAALASILFVFDLPMAFSQSKPSFSGTWQYQVPAGGNPRGPRSGSKLVIAHNEPTLVVHRWADAMDLGEETCTTDGVACQISTKRVGPAETRSYWEGDKLVTEFSWNKSGGRKGTEKFTHGLSADGQTITLELSIEGRPAETHTYKKQ